MPSRRSHTKSRHGCMPCKAGHVKCDLARPICGRCTKLQKTCIFPNLSGALSPPIPSTPSAVSPHAPDPFQSLEHDSLPWEDLELFHHYLTVTCMTLTDREDLQQMWRIQIPRIAMQRKFLMHSLFSIAALHIACSRTDNQTSYINRAIRHHDISLRQYSSELRNITRENGPAIFACASLISIFCFTISMIQPDHEPTRRVEDILKIFMLLRGIPIVMEDIWPWLRDSEISAMFTGRVVDDAIALSDDVTNALKMLEERGQISSRSEPEKETYHLAIGGVEDCFKVLSCPDSDKGMLFSWPMTVSQEYISLLNSRQPMALAILSFFAVSLYEIRDRWWTMNWGSQVIQEIYHMVDGDWKDVLAWPMERIGLQTSM